MFRYLVNFFYPPKCFGCGTLLALNSEEPVCAVCLAEIKRSGSGVFDAAGCRVVYSAKYENAAKNMIAEMKFRGGRRAAKFFALLMTDAFVSWSGGFVPDVITFVPLHRKRENERGFNQSEIISRNVSKILELPFRPMLRRIINTPSQREFDIVGRKKNVKDAFKFIDSAIKINGKKVLLVDDVATTGATLTECAKTLSSAGASEVRALVFAKT